MSPPEVWGPAVWRLIHMLSVKITDEAYPYIGGQLFYFISRICKFLPCPDCANDSTRILAKINIRELKTNTDFKNSMYLFHNVVNVKKRKPLFNYANIDNYKRYRLIPVINNFINNYNTRGNMKLITESFQRQLLVKQFKMWLMKNIRGFDEFRPMIKEIKIIPQEIINQEIVAQENITNSLDENVFPETVQEIQIYNTVDYDTIDEHTVNNNTDNNSDTDTSVDVTIDASIEHLHAVEQSQNIETIVNNDDNLSNLATTAPNSTTNQKKKKKKKIRFAV
jgi:hypothetical protein